MAANAISSNTKPHSHARSISLPNDFHRFQASQEATTSSSSSSSIADKLNRLNDMYETIETLLALPSTQQYSFGHKEPMNELLDELIELLDLCSTTKDALSMSMDSAKELQSVLRRKRGDNRWLILPVEEYLSQRRKVKKVVVKALSSFQKQCSSSIKKDHRTTSNVDVLKEMRSNSFKVFESLLTFVVGSNAESKAKGWSLVSKMVGYKRDQTLEESEVKKVDDEVHALIISCKKTKSGSLEVDALQMGLAELELQLLDLDEKIDCLSRHLIKCRVSILNIMNF